MDGRTSIPVDGLFCLLYLIRSFSLFVLTSLFTILFFYQSAVGLLEASVCISFRCLARLYLRPLSFSLPCCRSARFVAWSVFLSFDHFCYISLCVCPFRLIRFSSFYAKLVFRRFLFSLFVCSWCPYFQIFILYQFSTYFASLASWEVCLVFVVCDHFLVILVFKQQMPLQRNFSTKINLIAWLNLSACDNILTWLFWSRFRSVGFDLVFFKIYSWLESSILISHWLTVPKFSLTRLLTSTMPISVHVGHLFEFASPIHVQTTLELFSRPYNCLLTHGLEWNASRPFFNIIERAHLQSKYFILSFFIFYFFFICITPLYSMLKFLPLADRINFNWMVCLLCKWSFDALINLLST